MFSRSFDYLGVDEKMHTDTWWFNLTEAELLKLELGYAGMQGTMGKLLRQSETGKLVDMFENLILGAVGERSVDGRKFIKSQEIRDDFYQTQAYSDLFVELVKSGEALTVFLKGCVSEDIARRMEEAEKEAAKAEKETAKTETTAHLQVLEGRDPK